MAVMGGKLKTHSSTLDWEIGKWKEITFGELIKCPTFIFFPIYEVYFDLEKWQDNVSVYINPLHPVSPFSFHYKVCLIDQHGQERLAKTDKETISAGEFYVRLAEWSSEELKTVIRDEDPLIIRCTLSAESGNKNDDCTSQTEPSLMTGSMRSALERATQTEESDSLETDCTNFLASLSMDLETLYKEKTDTDCVLKTVDAEFLAHRSVLSARSKVFAAMFHHDTHERRTGEVNIPDVESTILDEVLHFVYTGKIRSLALDNAVGLYAAADKYALYQLRDSCLSFLLNNLELINICDAAIVAHTHGERALENKVIHFIVERFEEVIESDEWKSLLSKNSLFASTLLTAAFLAK